MPLPAGTIVHRSPGRMRIRVPEQVRNRPYFDDIRQRLLEHPEIKNVDVRAETGSILITGKIPDIDGLSEFVSANRLFKIEAEKTIRGRVHHSFTHTNEALVRTSGGKLDIPILLFLILVGTGFLQILRSGFQLPPWHTAFWYALGVLTFSMIDTEAARDRADA